MEHLTQLGVGGIFAVVILREIMPYVSKKMNGKSNGNGFVTTRECLLRNDVVNTRFNDIEGTLKDIKRNVDLLVRRAMSKSGG